MLRRSPIASPTKSSRPERGIRPTRATGSAGRGLALIRQAAISWPGVTHLGPRTRQARTACAIRPGPSPTPTGSALAAVLWPTVTTWSSCRRIGGMFSVTTIGERLDRTVQIVRPGRDWCDNLPRRGWSCSGWRPCIRARRHPRPTRVKVPDPPKGHRARLSVRTAGLAPPPTRRVSARTRRRRAPRPRSCLAMPAGTSGRDAGRTSP